MRKRGNQREREREREGERERKRVGKESCRLEKVSRSVLFIFVLSMHFIVLVVALLSSMTFRKMSIF